MGTVLAQSQVTPQLHYLGVTTVDKAEIAIPHGLDYTPTIVLVTPTLEAIVWSSTPPDGTNVYLNSNTTVDTYVYVG